MGKFIGGILGTLAIVALVLFLLSHLGLLSWGKGDGAGSGEVNTETVFEEEKENTDENDEMEEIEITIVVTQDKYLIDEQEVTLTQIREMVIDESSVIKVILEDNYASAKAWDDIKVNLTKWGVTPIEQ